MADVRCGWCGEPWDIGELEAEGITFREFKRDGCEAFGSSHAVTRASSALRASLDFAEDVDDAATDAADLEALQAAYDGQGGVL